MRGCRQCTRALPAVLVLKRLRLALGRKLLPPLLLKGMFTDGCLP